MRITLITGFLGAGKTTLVKRLLKQHHAAMKLGVIVNDLSELEVDGELIRMGHAVSEKDGNLSSLHDGSISDKRRKEFKGALAQMMEAGITHLIIEASGASHPAGIIEELRSLDKATLSSVVCLVDGRALWHDYQGGPELLRAIRGQAGTADRSPESLLATQLQVASVIALTKTDLLGGKDLEVMLKTLYLINPSAILTACTYGKLDSRVLFEGSYDFDALHAEQDGEAPTDPREYDIGNTIVRDVRPFHPQRLFDVYRDKLGLGIYRTKGFIWLASRPDHVLLWNQAGGAMGLELLGTWRVVVADDPKLLPEEREGMKALLNQAHPVFGDRGNELTVIGMARDREIFVEELKKCFCTDDEVAHWQKGGSFPDPWPKTHKRLT